MTVNARHQAGAPASVGGQFRETGRQESAGALTDTTSPDDPATAADFMIDLVDRYHFTDRPARNLTELRAALRNARGETDRDTCRQVMISWNNLPPATKKDDLAIVGPKDGRPIYVEIRGGHPGLTVESGYAIILADDPSGHSISVKDGATAVVVGRGGRKVSITAEAGSAVDFYAGNGTRGYQSVADGAAFQARGDLEHVTVADAAYRAEQRAKDVDYAARLRAAGEEVPAYLRYLDA